MLKWKTDTRGTRYGYLGKWKLFIIEWDVSARKGDEGPKNKLITTLPGITYEQCGKHYTVESAQLKAEQLVEYWIDNTITE
jgi:hypothetical protein